jgi:hypothetical protein
MVYLTKRNLKPLQADGKVHAKPSGMFCASEDRKSRVAKRQSG